MKPVIVKGGIFLYDNEITCDIRIVRVHLRPGSGDVLDEPKYRDDEIGEFYEIQYGSTSERGKFVAGVGWYDTIEAALESANGATNGTVKWCE